MEDELIELKVCDGNDINDISSSSTTNPQLLLNVILNNRHDEIDTTVAKYTKDILSHKFAEHENKTIIIIACLDDRVSKDTLSALWQSFKNHHYYDIDYFDDDWYKWEPLHYVAKIADPEKLEVLLDNSVELNSLTTFSENALHVLLEYQQTVKPFKTLLYNGTESRHCTVINTEKENIFQCAKILIKAGIDVNHSNFWNETPICIAVRYRYIRITELLLAVPTIDLDNYKEGTLTIRAYLKENQIRQDTLSQSNVLYEDPIKILFDYLKSGDEESFVHFNNENIKDYANSTDGDCEEDYSSGDMLQFCFKKGYLEYLQHDSYNEKLTTSNIMDNLMINIFYAKGLGRCIEHLLNNGADPTKTYRKFPQPLLETAALLGYYPLIAILLQHKTSQITSDDIIKILQKLYEQDCDLSNHDFYRKCILTLTLNKLLSLQENQILASEHLGILNNILHKLNLEGDDEKVDDSENICRILKLGASLTKRVENEKMIIEKIHPEILKRHFDDCIENNILCYNSIIEDDKKYSETRALHFLANSCEKTELLRHPLLIHFIHNKWLRNFYFFYVDLFLNFIFLISIYGYMVLSHRNQYSPFINALFFFLLTIHLIKECIQLLFLYHWKYFLDASNYLELSVIISSFVSIYNYNEYSAVIAILFATVIFVMLLGQVPICAKYTIIFGSTKYFLQYAGFYFIQFVAFALAFYIIFPFQINDTSTAKNNGTETLTETEPTEQDLKSTVSDLFKSLFYTLILFTGEFGDRVLEPEKFPVFGRVIMATFIFCMTIILNNLLVGLIVADMDEMQKAGKLYKQVKLANFIARMNAIVKRLYEFKTISYIKSIINFLHIFEKGENKILDLSKCKHPSVFDDENLRYLKNIRSKKSTSYNKDILKNIFILIQERNGLSNKRKNNVNNF